MMAASQSFSSREPPKARVSTGIHHDECSLGSRANSVGHHWHTFLDFLQTEGGILLALYAFPMLKCEQTSHKVHPMFGVSLNGFCEARNFF